MTTQWRDQCTIDRVVYFIGSPTEELPTLTGTAKLMEERPKTLISACWRGYVANWRVESGHLYLDAVDHRFHPVEPLPLLADWVSGSFDLSRVDGSGDYILKVTNGAVYGLVTRIAEDLLTAMLHPNPVTLPEPVDATVVAPKPSPSLEVPAPRVGWFSRWIDRLFYRSWEDRLRD